MHNTTVNNAKKLSSLFIKVLVVCHLLQVTELILFFWLIKPAQQKSSRIRSASSRLGVGLFFFVADISCREHLLCQLKCSRQEARNNAAGCRSFNEL